MGNQWRHQGGAYAPSKYTGAPLKIYFFLFAWPVTDNSLYTLFITTQPQEPTCKHDTVHMYLSGSAPVVLFTT